MTIRSAAVGESKLFGALAIRAFGEPPPGMARVDLVSEERRWADTCTLGRASCFFAERSGGPCAIGIYVRIGDVALVDGAATLPEHRRAGCQRALLEHRFREARAEGATLAITRTAAGSASQRNLERTGMRVFLAFEVWGEPVSAG